MAATTSEKTFDVLKPGDLKDLASAQADPCVSILMRTHRKGCETRQGSDNLTDVLKAASSGRIDSLMVCHHDEHGQKTNQAVIETLRNGGDVYQCSPESMPGNASSVAAIFRYLALLQHRFLHLTPTPNQHLSKTLLHRHCFHNDDARL